MKRLTLKKLMAATAVAASGLLVQGCDVMWDSALDGDPGYGGFYGDYSGSGFYNDWWPSLPGAPYVSPVYWGGSVYPGNYFPPAPPRPQRPQRPPQWNGGGNPGPIINVGNVRPGNSGNLNGSNPGPVILPSEPAPSRPSKPSTGTGNTRPSFTLTPSQLPAGSSGNSGQRPGRH